MGGVDLLFCFTRQCDSLPGWAKFITLPFSLIPYPAMWFVWTALCIVTIGSCAIVFNRSAWWLVFVSASFLYEVWSGQVESFVLLGVTLAWLVTQKKIHYMWISAAWLLMLIKPQVAIIPCVIFAYWLWKDRGIDDLLLCLAIFLGVASLSIAVFPNWPTNYIQFISSFPGSDFNASVFPFGLMTLPLVFLPCDRLTKLQIALAVNLLCSSYFQLYHETVLIAVTGNWLLALLSWLPVITGNLRLAWVVPAAFVVIIAAEVIGEYRRKVVIA